jgi:hypothetical protein
MRTNVDQSGLFDGDAPMLTPDSFAKLLGVCRRSLRRLQASGRVPQPTLSVGRIVRWDRRTVADWLAAGRPQRNRRHGRGKNRPDS